MFLLVIATPAFSQSPSFIALLEKANRGDADAQNELGIAYSEGKGVKPDQRKAVYWFRKSAEQGYALGACNLALHYRMGWGVRRNVTLMWKYTLAAHALDGLKCNPADVPDKFQNRECSMEKGWELAVAWLKAHPGFRNNFGRQPWNDSENQYPVTLREYGGSVQLPILRSKRCGGIAISQQPAVRVTGIVVDWQYARVLRTTIVFESEGHREEVTVNDEGAYEVDLPPGRYVVKASAPNFRERRVKLQVEPDAPRILNLMLTVPPQNFRCPKGAICL